MALPELDPWITAAYRQRVGRQVDPAILDYVAAFRDNPELLAAARAEAARLRTVPTGSGRPQRSLVEHDHESRIRCETLEAMLERFDLVTAP